MVVCEGGFGQKINWNGAWHVIYGWKDLPLASWFNIVYNESAHEHIKKWAHCFLTQHSNKYINILKPETEVFETAVCHPTHIYLSIKYHHSNLGYWLEHCTTDIYILAMGQW